MREATPNVAEARRMLKKGIVISGVGETEQGKLPGRGSFELLAEVTKITLDDAGLTLDEVDGMITAFSFVEATLMHSTTLAAVAEGPGEDIRPPGPCRSGSGRQIC